MSLAERDARGRWKAGAARYREVPVAPLREAFECSTLGAADVARALDWYDHRGRADGHRVKRALGIKPVNFGHGYGWKRIQSTSYDRALRIAYAIGVDPVDVGL